MIQLINTVKRKLSVALSLLMHGDIVGIVQEIKTRTILQTYSGNVKKDKSFKVCILTSKYNKFIAHIIFERLKYHKISVDVILGKPKKEIYDIYFVLEPHKVSDWPAKDKRICYELEQLVDLKWHNEKYINVLKESLSVIELSKNYIDILYNHGLNKSCVHYVPTGCSKSYDINIKINKKYDILFYGDVNSENRKKMLPHLQKHYNVKIVKNIFGNALKKIIKQSKIVINLHYYENASLEIVRIHECLSLGVPVVSESSINQNDYKELNEAVIYFTTGSIDSMLKSVNKVLNNLEHYNDLTKIALKKSEEKFNFMFDRFLYETQYIK